MHFGRLLRHPATLIIGLILFFAALIGVGSAVNIAAGGGAAVAVVLVVALVVFLIAGGQAREDFYNAYAQGRGLTRVPGRHRCRRSRRSCRRATTAMPSSASTASCPAE